MYKIRGFVFKSRGLLLVFSMAQFLNCKKNGEGVKNIKKILTRIKSGIVATNKKKEEPIDLLKKSKDLFDKGKYKDSLKIINKTRERFPNYIDCNLFYLAIFCHKKIGKTRNLVAALEYSNMIIDVNKSFALEKKVFLLKFELLIKIINQYQNKETIASDYINTTMKYIKELYDLVVVYNLGEPDLVVLRKLEKEFTSIVVRGSLPKIQRMFDEKNYLSCLQLVQTAIAGLEEFPKMKSDFQKLEQILLLILGFKPNEK